MGQHPADEALSSGSLYHHEGEPEYLRRRAQSTVRSRRSMRSMARTPLVPSAAVLLESLEAIDLSEITGGLSFEATVSAPDTRHA